MANILIVGVGCIGSVYACILNASGQARITCVCRSNYDAVKANGLKVTSSVLGNLSSRPKVARNVKEAIEMSQGPFHFVLLCTKATESVTAAAIEQIKPALATPDTALVIVQNGLGIEEPFRAAFPTTTIISGVAYLPTTKVSSATYAHSEVQLLHLGLYPTRPKRTSSQQEKLENFANLMRGGGANAMVHEDIQEQRWCKIVANGAVNPICALSCSRDKELITSVARGTQLLRDVMLEVMAVAVSAGYGHVVTEAVVEAQMARTLARPSPGVQPSMLADVLESRELEVQAMVGELVRRAGENGVNIPRLTTLYVLLEGLNRALQAAGA